MARVTESDIVRMKQVYAEVGTYSGTAKVVGFSASTVKKYVDSVAISFPKEPKNLSLFNGVVKEPEEIKISLKDDWTYLNDYEKDSLKDLWEEYHGK